MLVESVFSTAATGAKDEDTHKGVHAAGPAAGGLLTLAIYFSAVFGLPSRTAKAHEKPIPSAHNVARTPLLFV